ncbi:MAG: competence protein ComEC [Candidatus Endobugula sp.]|jgi:competence protein ComEC
MRYFWVFSTSLLLVSYFSDLPSFNVVLLILLIATYCLHRRYFLLACAMLGMSVGVYRGHQLVDQQLPTVLEGLPITVVGVVRGLPSKNRRRQRFLFQIESLLDQSLSSNVELTGALLQLSLYSYRRDSQPLPDFVPGQRWLLTLKVRRPRGFVNPAGMDYQAYLLRKGITATGYVINKSPQELLGNNCLYAWVDCVRWGVKQALLSMSQSHQGRRSEQQSDRPSNLSSRRDNSANERSRDINSIITALAVGDTHTISTQQWRIFKNTGTVHLLAISGLHIGLAATIGWVLGHGAMRLFGMLSPFSVSLRILPISLSIMMALSYSLLAGMSLPTQRAFIMVLAYQLSVLLYYRLSPWLLLSLALCGVSILDPLAPHSMGFWLSFLAVAVLLYGFSGRAKNSLTGVLRVAVQSISAQWLLFVGLLLPSLLWLQGGSSSAPLVNIFAIPWVSLWVVPAIFLLLFLLALQAALALVSQQGLLDVPIDVVYGWIVRVIDGLLEGLSYANQTIGGFWFAHIPQPSAPTIVLAAIGIVYLLAPKGLPYRRCAWVLLLPVVWPITISPLLRVTFLDVGQGTSVVVETPNHRLVYDTGRQFSDRFNTGEHIIAPYLRSTGGSTLNRLIVSHSDSDHAGGLSGLLRSISVDRLMYGEPVKTMLRKAKRAAEYDVDTNNNDINQNKVIQRFSPQDIKNKGERNKDAADINSKTCLRGQQWQWDGVNFQVLWPSPKVITLADQKSNNHSCVLLISVGNKHILLTGDIEREVEALLLNNLQMPLHVDIMLVPHHGSKTSSSQSFVDTLTPTFAVVTAGYQNQYGHPNQQVLLRYHHIGSNIINTAAMGATQFSLYDTPGDWIVDKWRKKYQRYWYQ